MLQYGDYKEFDHKPTKEEIEETTKEILASLSSYIAEHAVVKPMYGKDGAWTVGVRIMV